MSDLPQNLSDIVTTDYSNQNTFLLTDIQNNTNPYVDRDELYINDQGNPVYAYHYKFDCLVNYKPSNYNSYTMDIYNGFDALFSSIMLNGLFADQVGFYVDGMLVKKVIATGTTDAQKMWFITGGTGTNCRVWNYTKNFSSSGIKYVKVVIITTDNRCLYLGERFLGIAYSPVIDTISIKNNRNNDIYIKNGTKDLANDYDVLYTRKFYVKNTTVDETQQELLDAVVSLDLTSSGIKNVLATYTRNALTINEIVHADDFKNIIADASLSDIAYGDFKGYYRVNTTVPSKQMSATHQVYVIEKIGFQQPTVTKNEFYLGEQFSGNPTTLTINYGYYDSNNNPVVLSEYNTTDNVTVTSTYNPNFEGKQTIVCQATASRTGDIVTYSYDVWNFSLSYIGIEPATQGGTIKTAWNISETYSSAGIKVVAHYGSSGIFRDVTSEATITEPTWELSTGTYVNVAYNGKQASYKITISGYTNLRVEYNEAKLTVIKGGTLTASDAIVGITVDHYNGTAKANEVVALNNPNLSITGISTSTAGVRYITVSYQGLTDRKIYTVYDYTNLTVQVSETEKTYYKVSSAPKLRLDTLVAKVNRTDTLEEIILDNTQYSISPAVGSYLSVGTNTITVTFSGLTTTFNVNVINYEPAVGATLTVSPTKAVVYERGDKVLKSDYTVVVSEMTNGDTNVPVFNFELKVDNKEYEDLDLDSDDSLGTHNITVKFGGITSTLSNAFFLNGISSVTLNSSAFTYKIEDTFDPSILNNQGTINYADGTAVAITTNDITYTNIGSFTHPQVGSLTFPVYIAGFLKNLTLTIIEPSYIEVTTIVSKSYMNNAPLDTTTFSLRTVYTDNTTKENLSVNNCNISFDIEGCSKEKLIAGNNSTTVNATFTTSVRGQSITSSAYALTVLKIKSFKLGKIENNNFVEKTAFVFDEGQKIKDLLTGCIGRIEKNNGTYTDVEIGEDSLIYDESLITTSNISPTLNSVVSSHITQQGYIFVSAYGDTKYAYFDIKCKYLYGVELTYPNNFPTSLFVGDTISTTGITAQIRYKHSDTSIPDVTEELALSSLEFRFNNSTNLTANAVGTYTFTAFYNSVEVASAYRKSISVVADTLQSIAVSQSSSYKQSYIEREYLDLSGLKITRTYASGKSTADILDTDINLTIIDEDGEAISKKSTLLSLNDNGLELYAKYENKTCSIGSIVVGARAITSIDIDTTQVKSSYTYGDSFDLTGLVVTAKYNNDETAIVSNYTSSIAQGTVITVSDYPTSLLDTNITVTITYSTFTKTFTFLLAKPKLARITSNAYDLNTPVQLKYKNGDTYSESSLVVTAEYQNGVVQTLTSSSYSTDATTILNLVNNVITLTGSYSHNRTITITATNPYDNTDQKTATFAVEIITNNDIKRAVFNISEAVTSFVVGDTFTCEGIYFDITDAENNQWQAQPTELSIKIGTQFRQAQKITLECSYIQGDFVSSKGTVELTVTIPNKEEITETDEYKIAMYVRGQTDTAITSLNDPDGNAVTFGKFYDASGNLTGERYPVFLSKYIAEISITEEGITRKVNAYSDANTMQTNFVGYVELGVEEIKNAHLVLFDDPVNPIDGDSNITVKFPHYVEGNSDKINKCKFGKVYNNRLFLSGNPNHKNFDWHTSETNDEMSEFTYFSDLDYCKYGSDDTSVCGYDIYNDGDLIVIKEGSRNEATLYKRTTQLINATDYTGAVISGSVEEAYPCFPINSNGGEGGLSYRSVINFLGATLILTKSGLKVLSQKDNVNSNSKYAYDVSSYINPKLIKENLKDAFLYSFKDKLLLKTDSGIYVGYYNLRNEDNEYEWYLLSNIEAKDFIEINDTLYFSNDSGALCKLNNTGYNDTPRTFIGNGGALVDESANTIVVNSSYADKIIAGKPFNLITNYTFENVNTSSVVFAGLGKFINSTAKEILIKRAEFDFNAYLGEIDGNKIILKPESALNTLDIARLDAAKHLFYNGRKIYADQISPTDSMNLVVNKEYELEQVGENEYQIKGVVLNNITQMRLSFSVNDEAITTITEVSDYSSTSKQFKLLGDHNKVLDLIYYNGISTGTYSGIITDKEKVKAYYITPPYSMGSLVMAKKIYSWQIINDTKLSSTMDIGYMSSRKQGNFTDVITTAVGATEINYGSAFSFERFSCLGDGLPHIYNKKKTVPNVGVIKFKFVNNEDSNIVLTSLNIVYTQSTFLKGEK